jgi:hypothetical protein
VCTASSPQPSSSTEHQRSGGKHSISDKGIFTSPINIYTFDIKENPEPVFVFVYGAQESIPPAYVVWPARRQIGDPPGWKSIPGLLKDLQTRAQGPTQQCIRFPVLLLLSVFRVSLSATVHVTGKSVDLLAISDRIPISKGLRKTEPEFVKV